MLYFFFLNSYSLILKCFPNPPPPPTHSPFFYFIFFIEAKHAKLNLSFLTVKLSHSNWTFENALGYFILLVLLSYYQYLSEPLCECELFFLYFLSLSVSYSLSFSLSLSLSYLFLARSANSGLASFQVLHFIFLTSTQVKYFHRSRNHRSRPHWS